MVLEQIANLSVAQAASGFKSPSLHQNRITTIFKKEMKMKPGPNFKLSKRTKMLMAAASDRQYSNTIKRNFIQAELYATKIVKAANKREAND
jgi:hypothetical protein